MKLNELQCDVTEPSGTSEGETTPDVRHQIRYPLRAPVSFTWFSGEGMQREAKGSSRNIGVGGAYIHTRNCPQVGAQIILVIRFPYLPDFARFHRLEMIGQVVRAESLPKGKRMWGFAVASAWTFLQQTEDSCNGTRDAD